MANALMKIKTDETPWEQFPSYMKMLRPLKGELKKCRADLVKKVTDVYNKAFDQLEEYANKVGVKRDKFATRVPTITSKTSSHNFYALKDAIDTASFIGEQMSEIDSNIGAGEPKIRMVSLHTKTDINEPLRNEQDKTFNLQVSSSSCSPS